MLTRLTSPIKSLPHRRFTGDSISVRITGRNTRTRKTKIGNGYGLNNVIRAVINSGENVVKSNVASQIQNYESSNFNVNNEYLQVRAIVRIKKNIKMSLGNKVEDNWFNFMVSLGQAIFLTLISEDVIEPDTNSGKTVEAYVKEWPTNLSSSEHLNVVECIANFNVPSDFGNPGAILVTNCYSKEFYLVEIVLQGLQDAPVIFPANSWIHSRNDNPESRIIFGNQTYLPSQTPPGIKDLRRQDMLSMRGDGTGERKTHERVYDYAPYNDIGNADKDPDLARPVFGGSELPYPRRCRTGRPPMKTVPECESVEVKPKTIYLPRDEVIAEVKQTSIAAGRTNALLHNIKPLIASKLANSDFAFERLSEIEKLYVDDLTEKDEDTEKAENLLGKLSKQVLSIPDILKFDIPSVIKRDTLSWLRDSEFARQALAGVNPVNIELLKEFPIMSKLDPAVYGPPESAITKEVLEEEMNGMTVEEAIKNKKLFMIDYHDLFMPLVNKVNELPGRKMYASRTIFFYNKAGDLQPIVIELSLPPTQSAPVFKRAYTHGFDSTSHWLWKLAKIHACAVDADVHTIVSHWLKTHACVETFIIATHRQLSQMHPIYKLLHPHMRYTMSSNSNSRQNLINAAGIMEALFTPGRYCMEVGSAVYKNMWRFDKVALPADLLHRGMAEEDPSEPSGVKLVIEDYPYAADGLLVWSAIKEWVEFYVSHFYPESSAVTGDVELQEWWEEIKNKGHPDKKDEPWWPKLNTNYDLTDILTIMIWVMTGHHAAINFGLYPFGGSILNYPPLMRRLIPQENEPEYEEFLINPEATFLLTMPTVLQTTKVMAVHDAVATHSPDEEYLGQEYNHWSNDQEIKSVFQRFSSRMKEIEEIINQRNKDLSLKNRTGAGVPPYELLLPASGPGVTGRGVPNSITV